jgi:hypothetical protein
MYNPSWHLFHSETKAARNVEIQKEPALAFAGV